MVYFQGRIKDFSQEWAPTTNLGCPPYVFLIFLQTPMKLTTFLSLWEAPPPSLSWIRHLLHFACEVVTSQDQGYTVATVLDKQLTTETEIVRRLKESG